MSQSSSQTVRAHVTYSGRVQGVGFRFTTRRVAEQHDVTGWVRNMPDGTVELEVQGAAPRVEAFLDGVAQQFGTHIEDAQRSSRPPRDGESGFFIIH